MATEARRVLDVVAHSKSGLVDRRTPVVGAENTLTHGGIGLRLLLPVLAGTLPANLEEYVRQLEPAADLIGSSTVVRETMRELAVRFAGGAGLRSATVEVLGYEVDGAAEALAFAYPLGMPAGGPDRLKVLPAGVPLAGTCTGSWWCPLGRTNSLGHLEVLRGELERDGDADAATVSEDGTLADSAVSTVVSLDTAGRLGVVNRRCDTCTDLLALSILERVGPPGKTPAQRPADLAATSGGMWLIDPERGVVPLAAVDDEPVAWTRHGHDVTRRLAAMLDQSGTAPD